MASKVPPYRRVVKLAVRIKSHKRSSLYSLNSGSLSERIVNVTRTITSYVLFSCIRVVFIRETGNVMAMQLFLSHTKSAVKCIRC